MQVFISKSPPPNLKNRIFPYWSLESEFYLFLNGISSDIDTEIIDISEIQTGLIKMFDKSIQKFIINKDVKSLCSTMNMELEKY
jgi:hypothetical protein